MIQASSQTLYVSDLIANTVTLYPANVPNPSPIRTITKGISNPKGLWVDAAGTLYVANSQLPQSSIGDVTEYRAGSSTPSLTIPTRFKPVSVVTDSKGHLYVGADGVNNGTVEISEYASGSAKPVKTVFPTTLIGDPFMGGLAVDAQDDLYAAFFIYNKPPVHVVRFAPGLRRERDLALAGLDAVDIVPGLGRDASGNLYVGIFDDQVNLYPPGSRNPSRSIVTAPEYFTVTGDGALYTPAGDYVDEFLPGSTSPIRFAEGAAPTGAAVR